MDCGTRTRTSLSFILRRAAPKDLSQGAPRGLRIVILRGCEEILSGVGAEGRKRRIFGHTGRTWPNCTDRTIGRAARPVVPPALGGQRGSGVTKDPSLPPLGPTLAQDFFTASQDELLMQRIRVQRRRLIAQEESSIDYDRALPVNVADRGVAPAHLAAGGIERR